MELKKETREKILVVFLLIAVGILCFLIGIKFQNTKDKATFTSLVESNHNSYITQIKLFIDECNGSITNAFHYLDLKGNHLGVMFKCNDESLNNTFIFQYTPSFYK